MDTSRKTLKDSNIFFEENVVTGKYQQYIVERIDEQYGVASYPIATAYLKDIGLLKILQMFTVKIY